VAEAWRSKGYEEVAKHIEEHVVKCLLCLFFPERHRRRIRTIKGLEIQPGAEAPDAGSSEDLAQRGGVLEAGLQR